jgi:hypothetical protein
VASVRRTRRSEDRPRLTKLRLTMRLKTPRKSLRKKTSLPRLFPWKTTSERRTSLRMVQLKTTRTSTWPRFSRILA